MGMTIDELVSERDRLANQLAYTSTALTMMKADYEARFKADMVVKFDKIRADIEPKCDRINSLASVLPYTAHREIQELLCDIMNLCKAESEVENGNNN